jgi:hypothetical protein
MRPIVGRAAGLNPVDFGMPGDTHAAAALDPIGGLLGVREFPDCEWKSGTSDGALAPGGTWMAPSEVSPERRG